MAKTTRKTPEEKPRAAKDRQFVTAMARGLGLLPPVLIVFALDVRSFEPAGGLSAPAGRAVERACEEVLGEIELVVRTQLETLAPGVPALPHIRLDRALQFLIGDRLQ